jgi:hypothetical protein
MMLFRISSLALVLHGATALCGCNAAQDTSGSSEDESQSAAKRDAGKVPDKDAASRSSTKKDAGQTDEQAPVNADRPKSLQCGTNTCVQLEQTGFAIPRVCCFDEAEGRCSALGTNNKCQPPAEVDERCPSAPVFNTILKGCCTPQNSCGLDSSGVGMGCKDLADTSFRQISPGLPEPRSCDAIAVDGGMRANADAAAGRLDAGARDGGT